MWVLFFIILAPILLMLMLGLVLLPFHFFVTSIFNVITVPFQLLKIAFNSLLRANHALEHATINVIEERYGPLPLVGEGKENGFVIQGPFLKAELVYEAALVALNRLKAGEKDLVIHRRCGTSILASNFLFSLLFLFILWGTGHISILSIFLALLAAQVLGPSFGKWMQRFVTTSLRVGNMEIIDVEAFLPYAKMSSWPRRWQNGNRFFVRTRRVIS